MNNDPEAPDEVEAAAQHEAEDVAESFKRPAIGAIVPIRDPEDEPYVFRFEVGPAILTQLLQKLQRLNTQPLMESLQARYPGFYQLFLDGRSVYIGKTARPIKERLEEHIWKLRGRIPYERIGCKYAYVEDPSLVDVAEGTLINFFGATEGAEWNRTGFGSKVPGYNRGKQVVSKWELRYPADLSWPVTAGGASPRNLYSLIVEIASEAPITFSVPMAYRKTFRAAHAGSLNVPSETKPFVEWVGLVAQHLAAGWIIDKQPSGWYIVSVRSN